MSKYLTPYGPGNYRNLDSQRYQYSLSPSKSFDALFRTHVDLVSNIFPKMYGFTKLQDSDAATQKYLAVDGAELYIVPVHGNGVPVVREVHAQSVLLIRQNPDGSTWTVSVPRYDPYDVLGSEEPKEL
jgi:hypothetical protein